MKNISKTFLPQSIFDGHMSERMVGNLSAITNDDLGWNMTGNTTESICLQAGGDLCALSAQSAHSHMDTELGSRIETARLIIYSIVIIVAFFGNGLLVLTMTLTKKMRTTTNCFLLNMAIGDLLVAIVCAPYQLASWKFPFIKTFDRRICKTMPFVQLSTVGISIYTMVAVAIVRLVQTSGLYLIYLHQIYI